MTAKRQIFISYAHDDRSALDEFVSHVVPLEDVLPIKFWFDDEIDGGDYWSDHVEDAIDASDFFMLLMSPRYFYAPYVRRRELPLINERVLNHGACTLPVVVKKCIWQPFLKANVQAVPICRKRRCRAIIDWRPKADGYYEAMAQTAHAICRRVGVEPGTLGI